MSHKQAIQLFKEGDIVNIVLTPASRMNASPKFREEQESHKPARPCYLVEVRDGG